MISGKKKRLPGEIPVTSDVQMIPPLRQKSKRTKEPLDENERGELKICLKTNIQKTKIMASGPMSSLQIDGETMETVADFIFGGSKITADGDCSHEIKRCLLLRRKAMISPEYWKAESLLCHLIKAMVFPVVMYGCELDYKESWAWKNWCFWTVVLEKILWESLGLQPIYHKGNQSWIFTGRTHNEAETPIVWPPDMKN